MNIKHRWPRDGPRPHLPEPHQQTPRHDTCSMAINRSGLRPLRCGAVLRMRAWLMALPKSQVRLLIANR